MRSITLEAKVEAPALQAYASLRDFRRYPECSPAIQSVELHQSGDRLLSSWDADFGDGTLRWTEEDVFSEKDLTIAFQLVSGDIPFFVGRWAVEPTIGGCTVVFHAQLDMGIPSLADALEPIAAQTLQDNIASILNGLFEDKVRVVRRDHDAMPTIPDPSDIVC